MKASGDPSPPSPTHSALPRYTNVARLTSAGDVDDDEARLAIQAALTTRKREGLQAELRWEAEFELKRKREYDAAHAARAEANLRIEAMHQKQEQEQQQQNEARAARETAMAERLQSVAAEEVVKRKAAEQKISETEERLQQNLRLREQERAEARKERQRRTAENAERGTYNLQVQLDRKLQRQQDDLIREEENKERLRKMAEEYETKTVEHRAKYSAAQHKCQEKAAKRQQKIEENFRGREQRFEGIRKLGQDCLENKANKVRDARERLSELQSANRFRLRQEKNAKIKALKAGAERSLADTLDRKEMHLKTVVATQKEKLRAAAELVDQERSKLQETDASDLDKALAQFKAERAQAQEAEEERKQLLETRMLALRDHMVNRRQADEIKAVIRSGVQRNVNCVLADLGMATDAGKAAGEETAQGVPKSPGRFSQTRH